MEIFLEVEVEVEVEGGTHFIPSTKLFDIIQNPNCPQEVLERAMKQYESFEVWNKVLDGFRGACDE